MSTQNPDSNVNVFTGEQERLIKNSFDHLEKNLGITAETPDYLKRSFERKLAGLSVPKKSFFSNWKGFAASMVAALSVGILISRFVMMPATVATRGVGDDGTIDQSTSIAVVINTQNPKEFVFELISASLDANLEVEVIQAGGKYGLHIKPFRPNDKDQEKIRTMLGVNPETIGAVNVTVGSSKK